MCEGNRRWKRLRWLHVCWPQCPPVSIGTGGRLLLAKVVLEVVIRPVVSAEG